MGCKQDEVIAENINPSPEDLPKQESPLDVLPNNPYWTSCQKRIPFPPNQPLTQLLHLRT